MTHSNLRLATLALVLIAAGCGGGDDGPPRAATPTPTAAQGRPVTDAQAVTLARVLQQNWQHGGAAFRGSLEVRGVTIPMSGRVDFRSGRGTATLREPSAASRRYVWTRRAVFAQATPGSTRYTRQAPNADGDPVHSAIALINKLSAETIDNTANIKDQDARFLRSGSLEGAPVDVYRYRPNGNTTFWVGRGDGLLRQVEARFADGGRLVVTLTKHESLRVALPPART